MSQIRRIGLVPLLVMALSSPYATAQKKASKAEPKPISTAPWEQPQPERESLDLATYQRIRDEGIQHSRVMEYASGLMDGIGARLTGSVNMHRANEWTRDQLSAMGCSNAHLEDWGEFGMGWQQLNTWVRMTAPDFQVMIAQAAPWSPSTSGAQEAQAVYINIKKEEDLAKYKGQLAGKVILVEEMRKVEPVEKALFQRLDAEDLKKIQTYPLHKEGDISELIKGFLDRFELAKKIENFLVQEHAVAVILPSGEGENGGGSGGTIYDDFGADMKWMAYKREQAAALPVVVMAVENYGRIYRLLQANVPVRLEIDVQTKVTGEHEHGFNTVAEIPGSDPSLKDQVVMVGGHLDSWASGTGATDNGAGSVVALEVMRILNALGIKPRRTIRIGLWSGEEEGLLGSMGYVSQHFGTFQDANTPDQIILPDFIRKRTGPLQPKPEQAQISGYFNLDNGSGRIRGIYLQDNLAVARIFQQWIEPLHDLGVTTVAVRNTEGTDHQAFDAVGIPGFQFIQDPLDYSSRTHHSNMDVYEELRPEDLAQAATVEAIFVYNAAMRDQMLPRKPLANPDLLKQKAAPLKGVMPGVVETKEKDANK